MCCQATQLASQSSGLGFDHGANWTCPVQSMALPPDVDLLDAPSPLFCQGAELPRPIDQACQRLPGKTTATGRMGSLDIRP